jgi:hypothetical protein
LGDLWFDTTLDEMNIYNGFVWQSLVPTVSGADYKNHAAKHYWGGVDPISFHKLSPNIRVASEYATSGSGTSSDPYINGVQNAVADLPIGGGGILLPSNSIFEEEAFTLLDNTIHIRGNGKTSVIKLKDGEDDNLITIGDGSNQYTKLSITNLKIDGNKANQSGTSNGIYLDRYISYPYFRNLWIKDCLTNGIHSYSTEYANANFFVWVIDCLIEGSDDGGIVSGHQCNDFFAWGNVIREVDGNGIDMDGTFGKAQFNTLLSIGLTAIVMRSTCAYSTVIGNSIEYPKNHGIQLLQAYDNVISGNTIYGASDLGANTYHSIFLNGGSIKGVVIDGNVLVANPSKKVNSHIKLYGSPTNCVITNNYCKDAQTNNIIISGTGHIVRHNIGHITEKSDDTTITNGNTHVTVTHEMDVTPTSITVTGNHSEVSACWIVNITSTQFEIWVSAGVTYDRVVYWYAEAR